MDSEDEEITLTNFDSKSEGETSKTVVKTAWKEKKRVEIPFVSPCSLRKGFLGWFH